MSKEVQTMTLTRAQILALKKELDGRYGSLLEEVRD